MFIKLTGRKCLVVGAGTMAEPKIESLLQAGAETTVVAVKAAPKVVRWSCERALLWEPRAFEPADLDDKFLVIAATSSQQLNESVFKQARSKNVLCNVVDDPERCDFYYPAVVRRGQLQIAVSTGGLSPALAQRIRQELEQQFGSEYEAWLDQLGEARRAILARAMDPAGRLLLLHSLASRDAFHDFVSRSRPRGGLA